MTGQKYLLGRCGAGEADSASPGDWLTPGEASLLKSFRAPKRRRDWLSGRIAAKRLVADWAAGRGVQLDPRSIEIVNDRTGKPHARLPEELGRIDISISHSASGGVAALAPTGEPVGVDLESAVPRPSGFLSVMVHESEWTPALAGETLEQTRLWTAKEAVSKLLGTGLSVDLWDIRLLPDGDGRRLELHGRARERWVSMGSPEIRIDEFITPDEVLTIAYLASSAS